MTTAETVVAALAAVATSAEAKSVIAAALARRRGGRTVRSRTVRRAATLAAASQAATDAVRARTRVPVPPRDGVRLGPTRQSEQATRALARRDIDTRDEGPVITDMVLWARAYVDMWDGKPAPGSVTVSPRPRLVEGRERVHQYRWARTKEQSRNFAGRLEASSSPKCPVCATGPSYTEQRKVTEADRVLAASYQRIASSPRPILTPDNYVGVLAAMREQGTFTQRLDRP